MWEDEIVNEVRQAREAYAAQFNYDLEAIYRDIKQREQSDTHDLIAPPSERPQQAELVIAPQIGTEGKSAQRAQHVGQGR